MLPGAVLLDLDGTLVDSESIHAEGIARYMKTLGIELTASERDFVIGHAWQEIHAHIDAQGRAGIDIAQLQRGTAQAEVAMRSEGIDIEVLAGGAEVVAMCVALDIPRCIVSGSSRSEIEHALTLLGFGSDLAFYMGAEDYARGKPAPDGYLGAAERLGVEPSRCLVIEDSTAGIESARNAGMRVIATSAANLPPEHSGHQEQASAHRIVASLLEIDEPLVREVMATGS